MPTLMPKRIGSLLRLVLTRSIYCLPSYAYSYADLDRLLVRRESLLISCMVILSMNGLTRADEPPLLVDPALNRWLARIGDAQYWKLLYRLEQEEESAKYNKVRSLYTSYTFRLEQEEESAKYNKVRSL
eukprot:1465318-Pyramimonas_sp.AAC.1